MDSRTEPQLTAAAPGHVPLVLCSVLPRNLLGWPGAEQGGRVRLTPLEIALTRAYSYDAHFVLYTSALDRRLNVDAVDQGATPKLCGTAFDLDCPLVHGTNVRAPDDWRVALRARFEQLLRVHPNLILYETRGGARIVARLDPPMTIASRADAALWSEQYLIACAYLRRCFELHCDTACVSWNWLFRLPRATRKGQSAPEDWPMYGDPSRIGVLRIEADERDLAAARRMRSTRFARSLEFTSPATNGQGLLYHLCVARGLIVREHTSPGAFVVACPNGRAHTTGCTGDGSCLLYAPASGEQIGALHCKHAHCAGLRVRDWIALFTKAEVDAARSAAGIARTA